MVHLMLPTLPVADLDATRRFWRHLGFDFSADFSADSAACLVVSDRASVMFLQQDFFRALHEALPHTGDGVVMSLATESPREVERLCRLAREASATHVRMPVEGAPVCRGSFRDPDGHLWEFFWSGHVSAASGDLY